MYFFLTKQEIKYLSRRSFITIDRSLQSKIHRLASSHKTLAKFFFERFYFKMGVQKGITGSKGLEINKNDFISFNFYTIVLSTHLTYWLPLFVPRTTCGASRSDCSQHCSPCFVRVSTNSPTSAESSRSRFLKAGCGAMSGCRRASPR